MMGLTAPLAVQNRPVIDAEGYPVLRPRRGEPPPHAYAANPPPTSGKAPRAPGVLDFAQRVGQRLDQEAPEREQGYGVWRDAARSNYPVSTFLAQHYAQEEPREGLALDPYVSATGAYARTDGLFTSTSAGLVSIAV